MEFHFSSRSSVCWCNCR